MDHETAIATQAVERYLLNELTPERRDEFEAHYFECPACANEVRTGTALMINGRALALEGSSPFAGPRLFDARRWMIPTTAAASVLFVFCAYQNLVVIPRLSRDASSWQTARAVPSPLLRAETRGGLVPLKAGLIAAGPAYGVTPTQPPQPMQVVKLQPVVTSLTLEIPTSRNTAIYDLEIRPNAGGTVTTITHAASQDGQIVLFLPSQQLSPGVYEVLVRDPAAHAQLSRFIFQTKE
jgi:hypothetical protein